MGKPSLRRGTGDQTNRALTCLASVARPPHPTHVSVAANPQKTAPPPERGRGEVERLQCLSAGLSCGLLLGFAISIGVPAKMSVQKCAGLGSQRGFGLSIHPAGELDPLAWLGCILVAFRRAACFLPLSPGLAHARIETEFWPFCFRGRFGLRSAASAAACL